MSKLRENLAEKFGDLTDMVIPTENFLTKIQDTMSEIVKLKNKTKTFEAPVV